MKHLSLLFAVRKVKFTFMLLILCAWFCLSAYGQDSTSASKQPLNYFKLEIGMHILECPVLPPRLKEKISAYKGVENYITDWKTQSILFNVPQGVITKEQVVSIAIGCGFPVQAINVMMDTKPFGN